MAATLWTPNFQVSHEKVHKTSKTRHFLRKYLKRLRTKTPRGGIAYFEFSTLKSFFDLFAFETKQGQSPPPIGKRVNKRNFNHRHKQQ
jgi:hypothetical protein